jgi:hypothetical protein
VIALRQLLVRQRGLDPTAWTALEAMLRGEGPGRPAALARAAVWEFAWEEDGGTGLAERLEAWVAAANWFANPNRDRATWRTRSGDATDLASGAALASGGLGSPAPGAHLVTAWRGAAAASEHAAAAAGALGCPVAVRRGEVWWLAAEAGDAASILEWAGAAETGGLLANPHSQRAVLYPGVLPVPAVPAEPGPARRGEP